MPAPARWPCDVSGCRTRFWKKIDGKRHCRAHWLRATGKIPADQPKRERIPFDRRFSVCAIGGCFRKASKDNRTLCRTHYFRRWKGVRNWDAPIGLKVSNPGQLRKVYLAKDVDDLVKSWASNRGMTAVSLIREIVNIWATERRDLVRDEDERGRALMSEAIPDFEEEDRDAIIRRMIESGSPTEDIRDAVSGISMGALHQRVSRIKKEMARV